MPTSHAYLSPSAAKRWMTCTPSAKAEHAYPDRETSYAKEGTIAHACAELILTELLRTQATELPEFNSLTDCFSTEALEKLAELRRELEDLGQDKDDFAGMLSTVFDYYVTVVFEDYLDAKAKDPETQLFVEAQINLSFFIPEGFGSADAVLVTSDEATYGIVHVYDLKYGRGVRVDADHNPQMMCYALGALYGVAELYAADKIVMSIIQPRLQHISTWQTSFDDLTGWGNNVLKPAAEKAFKGEGEYVPGEHCKFCKHAARCRALAAFSNMTATAYGEPERLTDEELADALSKLPTLQIFIDRVSEYAQNQLLAGKSVPGFKLVEGRSTSRIQDTAGALEALRSLGFDEKLFMKDPELKGITDLKKLLRAKPFQEILGPFVVKAPGKPTLAPESDPRPVYQDGTISNLSTL